ncbi:stage II sporulation protein M [Paenibacillus oralis]|uniref:Stage II sporulation protein M n=1 Tax=Paenibacillus oralis TaxID=2490856 RepID=A0A3P3TVC6_9BACL|nr:stage II sporulation protein M [Paenibacillus oralis]RRJ62101.1 stage II sporulation protein M [Paenibacillus oralis]
MFSFKRFMMDLVLYRKAMLISFLIFAAGVALGAANADALTRLILPDLEKLGEYSRQLSQTETPELHFFTFIFLNNALKSVAIMVLGGLLGLLPGIFLLMNGVALGYVVAAASSRGEHVLDLIVRGLLPHGIIEIPAILIASGFGLQFGYLVIKSLGERGARDPGERTVDWRGFFTAFCRGACWVVLLLVIAAVIESTLTFYLVGS